MSSTRCRPRGVSTRWPCSSRVPYKTGGVQDVGGTRTMQITTFSIHGSRPFDQRLMINGITSRNLLSSAWASNFVPDMGTAAEVVVDYSSGTAESVGGGLGINVIPKEGGNRFAGSFFVTGANGSLQANNYTDELKAPGLSSPNKLNRVYDINPSGGGPVFKDKLWFYGSLRLQESSFFQAGAFANKNGGDLTKWTYEPDLSQARRRPADGEPERERPADLAGDAAGTRSPSRPSRRTATGSMG